LRYAGPGIVIAVTGVGAGDMVSSLVAGTDFGMVLLWAVVLGAILKYFLTEGIGRWYMASGQTILQGWRSLGRWAIWYFVVYLFIVTFVFGAAVTSTAALAVDAAFPGVLPLWAWAALHSVAAFAVLSIGRYGLFENIMKTFAALKFGIVILLAILLAPSLGEIVLGFVPRIPEGALINVLAIIGGVGGTYSLAAYTYWVRERGWRHSAWIPTMRTDLTFG
jgi:Mn2+/Fe2+ NRAMP family transporter